MNGSDEIDDESSRRKQQDPQAVGEGPSLPRVGVLFYLDVNVGGRMLTISVQHEDMEDATWTTCPGSGA